MPRWDRAASHALGPGAMRTQRNKPICCAFRNALSDRAICFGLLCIGLALEAATNTSGYSKLVARLKFRLTVRANALECPLLATDHRRSNPKSEYVAVLAIALQID